MYFPAFFNSDEQWDTYAYADPVKETARQNALKEKPAIHTEKKRPTQAWSEKIATKEKKDQRKEKKKLIKDKLRREREAEREKEMREMEDEMEEDWKELRRERKRPKVATTGDFDL